MAKSPKIEFSDSLLGAGAVLVAFWKESVLLFGRNLESRSLPVFGKGKQNSLQRAIARKDSEEGKQ